MLIQIVAALLLLLGSALIFRALVEIDPPAHPRAAIRRRLGRLETDETIRLPRAA